MRIKILITYLFFSITMELFNKALFLSQQKTFALTHRLVYTLMVNLFQGVPELADQIETVYSLMVMKVKNV
jgi:hypothetical protein